MIVQKGGLIWAAASGVQYTAAAAVFTVRQAQAAAAVRWRNTTPLPTPLLLYRRAGYLSLSLLCFSFTHIPLQACPPGCMPIFWLLTVQKLNFSSLDSNNNWLKLTPAHSQHHCYLYRSL